MLQSYQWLGAQWIGTAEEELVARAPGCEPVEIPGEIAKESIAWCVAGLGVREADLVVESERKLVGGDER